MNCTDPVRDRLVDVTDQTVVATNQAAAAASLNRVGGLATGRRPAWWASRGAETYYRRKEDDDHAALDCQV
jgi:hypothetical protein